VTDSQGCPKKDSIEIRRMWEGGPLRQISATARGRWTIDDKGEFRGPYVCDECLKPVSGIYEPKRGVGDGRKWLCAECRTKLTPKQQQPESLRKEP
jgi:hypothetical protein